MGYYVSNMIGIRTGGVFSGDTDTKDFKKRLEAVLAELHSEKNKVWSDVQSRMNFAVTKELEAGKGAYIVIAGVFNYWRYEKSSELAKRLSKEFGSEVMHMCWDEEQDEVQCNIWLDGKPLFQIAENPIGRILRRII